MITLSNLKRASLSLLLCIIFCSCQTTGSKGISFRVAERYFVNNDVKTLPSPKISSQNEFDKLFGCAPVMGKNGMPTPIDFSKEYVIAVSKPETYLSTTLSPVSLKRDQYKNIVFTYKVTNGTKQTYSIVPFLMIIVNKKEQGNVVLKELQ
jgi:hypothetical protein